jgi:hypothetical protein
MPAPARRRCGRTTAIRPWISFLAAIGPRDLPPWFETWPPLSLSSSPSLVFVFPRRPAGQPNPSTTASSISHSSDADRARQRHVCAYLYLHGRLHLKVWP